MQKTWTGIDDSLIDRLAAESASRLAEVRAEGDGNHTMPRRRAGRLVDRAFPVWQMPPQREAPGLRV